jgi:type IX secretion system PorP/SprF family membrane protein
LDTSPIKSILPNKDKWTKGRHIPKSILSVGLRAGYNFFTNDLTKANLSANPTNNPDQSFQTNYNDQLFNVGFGIVYKIDKFYLSLSVPSIITTTPNSQRPLEVRSFFLATGSSYEINSNFKVQPNFLIKMSEGSPLQYDLNVNLVFNDLVWTGFTYRTSESVDFLFQLQATKTLRFGYSFDLLTNGLMAESIGTHEVMIKLSLPAIKAPKNTCVYPNYF